MRNNLLWHPYAPPKSALPSPAAVDTARAETMAERTRLGISTVVIVCERCGYEAEGTAFSQGRAEGKAVRELSRHLFDAHRMTGAVA
jgi:hypothetical protein